jgi:hypothetical protein
MIYQPLQSDQFGVNAAVVNSNSKNLSAVVTYGAIGSLSADYSTNIAPISSKQFGANLGAWTDMNVNATSPSNAYTDVQTSMLKSIRWPGGTYSDTYHFGGASPYTSTTAPSQCSSYYTNARYHGYISGTTLTVTSMDNGTIEPATMQGGGMVVNVSGVVVPTKILSQLTGSTGGVGTYSLSGSSQTVGSSGSPVAMASGWVYNIQTANPNNSWPNYQSYIATPGGYETFATVAYGTNATCDDGADPNEAAAWVANAKANGYNVHYWSVGNEEFGGWENDLNHQNFWVGS